MKALLTLSFLLSTLSLNAMAARQGETCPDGLNQVAKFYLDRDGRCRAVVLYCRSGILRQLELRDPPTDPRFCQLDGEENSNR